MKDILFPHCCFHLQVRLLCVATQYGDLQSVCYLLKEARIPVPLEPSNSNPAVLAAHYGHTDLVKELLDSVPGRSTASSPTFIICAYIDSLCIILVLIIHYKMNDHQQWNVGHLVLNRTTFQIYGYRVIPDHVGQSSLHVKEAWPCHRPGPQQITIRQYGIFTEGLWIVTQDYLQQINGLIIDYLMSKKGLNKNITKLKWNKTD